MKNDPELRAFNCLFQASTIRPENHEDPRYLALSKLKTHATLPYHAEVRNQLEIDGEERLDIAIAYIIERQLRYSIAVTSKGNASYRGSMTYHFSFDDLYEATFFKLAFAG